MKNKLQEMVAGYGFGFSVQELVHRVYWSLVAEGLHPCVVNDRYLEIEGITYQFRKTRSKCCWTVVEI